MDCRISSDNDWDTYGNGPDGTLAYARKVPHTQGTLTGRSDGHTEALACDAVTAGTLTLSADSSDEIWSCRRGRARNTDDRWTGRGHARSEGDCCERRNHNDRRTVVTLSYGLGRSYRRHRERSRRAVRRSYCAMSQVPGRLGTITTPDRPSCCGIRRVRSGTLRRVDVADKRYELARSTVFRIQRPFTPLVRRIACMATRS